MRNVLIAWLFLLMGFVSVAGPFTQGNIIVVRLGTGSGTLNSAACAVFLDEYTPAGTLVQSIAMPTAVSGGNHMLTNSGSATSEAALTLSSNGQYLVLCGYDAAVGTASVATADNINRTIARIGIDGVPNTSTGITAGGAFVKSNIRGGVTSDGTGFWVSGSATSGNNTGGIHYLPFGSFTATTERLSTSLNNSRVINIFDGQLYVSAASSTYRGVNTVGTGLPTTAGQTITNLAGFPGSDTASSAYGFYFFDMNPSVAGMDVVYVCDDRTAGGLLKYSLVGGTWVANGAVTTANSIRGITGTKNGNSVKLFISAENGIYTLTDASGYNQPVTGSLSKIVTPVTNTRLRGIAFAPGLTCQTSITASVSALTHVACNGGSTGAINIIATGGSSTYTYDWGGSINTQNRANLAAGTYTVTVNDGAGCTDTASATILQPTAINITTMVTNLPCTGGNTGAVDVTVIGGTPGYTYAWTNSATTEDITALSTAGTYTVTVTDTANCTAAKSIVISQSGDMAIAETITNVKCYAGTDGSIALAVSGGTPGYNYAWTGGGSAATKASLEAGSYTVTVTDNGGCTLINTFTVTEPDSISLNFTVQNASAFGAADGSVNLSVSGGTPSYTFSWNNGAQQQNMTGLSADTYCVEVSDQNQCTASRCVTVSQPAGIEDAAWLTEFNAFYAAAALHVQVELMVQAGYRLSLFDIAGRFISATEVAAGNNARVSIPVANCAPGSYILQMETGRGAVSKRVFIAN